MDDSNRHGSASATVDDVAAHFGVSTRSVERWLASDDPPPHRRVGKLIRFNIDEVDEWAAQRGKPATAASEEVA